MPFWKALFTNFTSCWTIRQRCVGVEFESSVSAGLKLSLVSHCYIIFDLFWSWVKSKSVTRSDEYRIVGYVLNTSVAMTYELHIRLHKLLQMTIFVMRLDEINPKTPSCGWKSLAHIRFVYVCACVASREKRNICNLLSFE